MASLSLQHIYKVYDNGAKLKKGQEPPKPAVSDFCMDIEDKEFIVFVGPSGCGKSTTLRMVAGLEEITAGDLYIGDVLVNDVEPKDRDIAMVFQNYALYPHMTVYNNMAFGLRLKKITDIKKDENGKPVLDENGNEVTFKRHYTKEEIDEKVQAAAKILEIEEYLERKPKALSGGQRQRVALGRAIVRNPKVFLLDEPLSNLDAKLRSQMRTEITKLHEKLQTTFIYVTHDQVEAMTMGSRIVVMKDGFIQQIGTPHHLFRHPANKFVASFIGTPQMNLFEGSLSKEGVLTLDVGGQIVLPQDKIDTLDFSKMNEDGKVYIGIRPDDVSFNKDNAIIGEVDLVEELGNESIIYATVGVRESEVIGQSNLVAKINSRVNVVRGAKIPFCFDIERLHIFDRETELSIEKDVIPNPKQSSAITIEAVE